MIIICFFSLFFRFIDSFGYVNLFPLLMQLIPPNSPQLGYTLQHLRNESVRHNVIVYELCTSKASPL